MTIFDRLLGRKKAATDQDFTVSSQSTAKEFGKVDVRNTGQELQIQVTILMEPQGVEAEGWQTGVALDASSSMKGEFGRMLVGSIPPNVAKTYEKRGWVESRMEDGRRIKAYKKEAYEDALQQGHVKRTNNTVEPLAQQFIAYLAGNLDADGGTTVIYWACGDGSAIDVAGDFTEDQCRTLELTGPISVDFGTGTRLTPAVKYFVDRFKDAKRGMYLFITDGKLDDLDDVKKYTIQLAQEIAAGKRHSVKCVLIGLGDEVDESQMEELDNLDTGTEVDIWDHKIAKEMRALVEIFAEVVDENQIIAPTGIIYDAAGKITQKFTDGLPARISFNLPLASEWFELEVGGQRIRQTVLPPTK